MKLIIRKLFRLYWLRLFNSKKAFIQVFISTVVLWLMSFGSTQVQSITFKLDVGDLENVENVSIRGGVDPLSWDRDFKLQDSDGDNIYEATIFFNTSSSNLKFRFNVNGKDELDGSDARVIWFEDEPVTKTYKFNEFPYYSKQKIKELKFSDEQIEEDISILRKIVQYVHPRVYKFRDSISLQDDFELLEREMKENPILPNIFGSISKFAAKIKCSHTFTNPWNQSATIEQALFHQPDKIPFTFKRIGTNLFIDKNASGNSKLKRGLAIVSINGMATEVILTRLSDYVTSDGNNYEKKLERLTLNGAEKFALFDIFYPIEFGSPDEFKLVLRDLNTNEEFEATVKATSKTNRTKVLIDQYGSLATSLKDSWSFDIMDDQTARLAIKSFAVHRGEFDWKDYLDNVFEQLNARSISNFIIDIRENEGGQGEVGEYILRRIIQTPLKIQGIQSSVSYLRIPEEFKKYINTWDQFPYNFESKIEEKIDGKYYLKKKYTLKGKTYKPMKNGFAGKVYLLTDASNSSATHMMATYAKQIDHVTLVGQETGGNQLGINGSFMFFLKLPNTKVELDIPVINMVIPTGNTLIDGGIKPDVSVAKSPKDFMNGTDTELNKVLELIKI